MRDDLKQLIKLKIECTVLYIFDQDIFFPYGLFLIFFSARMTAKHPLFIIAVFTCNEKFLEERVSETCFFSEVHWFFHINKPLQHCGGHSAP